LPKKQENLYNRECGLSTLKNYSTKTSYLSPPFLFSP
jgi:hypothetical protein